MRMNCNLLTIGNFHEPGSLVHQPVVRNRKQDGEIATLSARFLLQTKLLACKLALMRACFRLGRVAIVYCQAFVISGKQLISMIHSLVENQRVPQRIQLRVWGVVWS